MSIEKWVLISVNSRSILEVSNFGNTRRNKVPFKNKPGKRGYVHLRSNGATRKLHQLVWDTFKEEKRVSKLVINHKDCNPSNNHIDNLELIPQKENVRHAFRNRSIKRHSGEKNHMSVLSDAEIIEIRTIGHSLPKKTIAGKYGISRVTVSRILAGRRNTSSEPVVRYNYQIKKSSWAKQ